MEKHPRTLASESVRHLKQAMLNSNRFSPLEYSKWDILFHCLLMRFDGQAPAAMGSELTKVYKMLFDPIGGDNGIE